MMKQRKNIKEIASRMRTIRKQNKLSVLQMSSQLGIGPNGYRKYERALNIPPLQVQALLSEKFDISLDWFILNRGPMHISEIETALREKEQRKHDEQQNQKEKQKVVEIGKLETEEKQSPGPAIPPDAMIVTAPEIKELLRYIEDNPVFKYKLLTYLYQGKQGGEETGEISETGELPFE